MSSFDISSILNLPNLENDLKKFEKQLIETTRTDNKYISKPLSRLIEARGKRLRPALVMSIVSNSNKKITNKVIQCCIAVELVHIASLIHDDIIDNADTRWKTATINSKEGVNDAIIIGDWLFAKANEVAAGVSAEVATIIARVIQSLGEGELNELKDTFNMERQISSLLNAINGKTAALVSAACKIGGICAGLDQAKIASLDKYGRSFGMSFQFVDDLLDLLSSEKLLGKPTGNDLVEGVYTMPVLLSMRDNNDSNLKKELSVNNMISSSNVADLLIKDGSIQKSLTLVDAYNKLAVDELYNISDTKLKNILSKLPSDYSDWAMHNLVQPKYSKIFYNKKTAKTNS